MMHTSVPHWNKTRGNSKVLVGEDSLRVHVPVLGTRPSTKGVYKVIENLSPEKNQHQNDNIFG